MLAAAGRSTRMGFDKLLAELGGRPVLAWSAAVLAASGRIDRLVVVTAAELVDVVRDLLGATVVSAPRPLVLPGGERRRDSVEAGVRALDDCEWIVVHDGARPFLTPELVSRGLAAAGAEPPRPDWRLVGGRPAGEPQRGPHTGAAIAALPVRDTIKRVVDGLVTETPPRAALWAVQTPQVFRRDLLLHGLAATPEDVTDEAILMERIGVPVRVFEGDDANFKITTPHDLDVARALLPLRDRERVVGYRP